MERLQKKLVEAAAELESSMMRIIAEQQKAQVMPLISPGLDVFICLIAGVQAYRALQGLFDVVALQQWRSVDIH